MAIKHVITRGYGFSGGIGFLPTRGYTPSVALPAVTGPFLCVEGLAYSPGGAEGKGYSPGGVEAQGYTPGGAEGRFARGS